MHLRAPWYLKDFMRTTLWRKLTVSACLHTTQLPFVLRPQCSPCGATEDHKHATKTYKGLEFPFALSQMVWAPMVEDERWMEPSRLRRKSPVRTLRLAQGLFWWTALYPRWLNICDVMESREKAP